MKSDRCKLPPGPRSWLPWGVFGELRRDPLLFLTRVAREYGEIASFLTLGRRYVVVSSPELAKEILLTQADAFWKGRALQNSKGILGEGLLTAEGEMHKCQRRVMQPAFHAKRVEAYGPAVVECTRKVCDEIGPSKDGTPHVVDLRAAMMRLTLVIAGRTLFGAMLEEEVELVGRSMEALMGNYGRTVVPWGKLLNVLPLPSTVRLERARRELMGLVDRMIAGRRRETKSEGERGDAPSGCPMGRSALPDGRGTSGSVEAERGDLLSALLAASDPEGNGTRLTDQQVRDQAITILTASHETTANAMTFTLYLLVKYPAEQELLREEMVRVLGGREPAVEDLEKLERVRWVLSESMRLLPPAWTLGRENQREVEIGGYVIPAKSTFLIPQWVMHRDERFFPKALEFRPGRWKESVHPRYAYLPFSTGPRNCIGESFAWVEMMLALSMLIQNFKFEIEDGGEMGLVPAITLRPKEKVMVRVASLSTNDEARMTNQI